MRLFLALLVALFGSTVGFAPPPMAGTNARTTNNASFRLYNAPRHDVRSDGAAKEMDPEEMKIQAALAEHQQQAPKLGFDVDVRSLVQYNHGFAVMVSSRICCDANY